MSCLTTLTVVVRKGARLGNNWYIVHKKCYGQYIELFI
jgi:hypothetical protein